MALPSTYLTLEQLRRARSRERGQQMLAATQQAQQALTSGLGQINAEALRQERAKIEAAKAAEAAAAAREQRALQAENLRLQGERIKQKGAAAQAAAQAKIDAKTQADAAELAGNPRVPLTPDEYEAATGAMMGAVKAGASEPAAQAASNKAWRDIQAGERKATLDENKVYGQNAARELQADVAQQNADTRAAELDIKRGDLERKKADSESGRGVDAARVRQIDAKIKGGKGKGARAPITAGMSGRALLDASKGRRPLDTSQVSTVATYKTAITYSDRTRSLYNEMVTKTGLKPRGKLGNWINSALRVTGLAPEWKRMLNSQMTAVQLLGRASEGGKLTDPDYLRYQEIFGNPETSTAEEFENALADVAELSRSLYDDTLEGNARAGRDVSAYPLSSEMGSGAPAASPAPSKPSASRPSQISAEDIASSRFLPDGRMEITMRDGSRVRVKPDALSSFVVGGSRGE